MRQVLVVHALNRWMRRTTIEFVNSFAAYSPPDVEVRLHNVRRPLDQRLAAQEFDALILPYDVLSLRSSPQWEWALETTRPFAERSRQVIAFPQDDYTYNSVLDEGLEALGTDVIYTPIETGLDLVYPRMHAKAAIRTALTGYVDEDTAARWRAHRRPPAERPIDVGQRVRLLPPWFGRSGRAKGLLAERFRDVARGAGLKVDISTDDADTFAGEDWYRFLLSCRATLGQRGGASLCDPDGSIMEAVLAYEEEHPDADFDEIESACFPGLDGVAEMKAISPRLFDAAMLGTVQILVEDDYLGVLEPWVHYIPTDPSVSNIDEIKDTLADSPLLERIADAAEDALVRSGRFTYRRFMDEVFGTIGDDAPAPPPAPPNQDAATELQIRLTAELFDALQRITQLAAANDACSALADLSDAIAEILVEDPGLADVLDLRVLEAVVGPVRISRTIDPVLEPTVDILVECASAGASSAVSKWLRFVSTGAVDRLQLLEWIDAERIALDEGLPT